MPRPRPGGVGFCGWKYMKLSGTFSLGQVFLLTSTISINCVLLNYKNATDKNSN